MALWYPCKNWCLNVPLGIIQDCKNKYHYPLFICHTLPSNDSRITVITEFTDTALSQHKSYQISVKYFTLKSMALIHGCDSFHYSHGRSYIISVVAYGALASTCLHIWCLIQRRGQKGMEDVLHRCPRSYPPGYSGEPPVSGPLVLEYVKITIYKKTLIIVIN